MKDLPEDIVRAALALPPSERAALAGRLFESLEDADDNAEAAWSEEIATRVKELETGQVLPIPWSDARRKIVD
jgi:putative addiction module component (TIGR02574 family)